MQVHMQGYQGCWMQVDVEKFIYAVDDKLLGIQNLFFFDVQGGT